MTTDAAQTDSNQGADAVSKMYRDSELFMSRWNALVSVAPYVEGGPLESRFRTLMENGDRLRQRIDGAHTQVRDMYSKAGQIIGASWVKARRYIGAGDDAVLPPLPGGVSLAVSAAASAASIAMLAWARDADRFIAQYNGQVRSTQATVGTPVVTGMGVLPSEKTLLEKVGLPSIASLGRLALVLGVVWGVGKWRKWW